MANCCGYASPPLLCGIAHLFLNESLCCTELIEGSPRIRAADQSSPCSALARFAPTHRRQFPHRPIEKLRDGSSNTTACESHRGPIESYYELSRPREMNEHDLALRSMATLFMTTTMNRAQSSGVLRRRLAIARPRSSPPRQCGREPSLPIPSMVSGTAASVA